MMSADLKISQNLKVLFYQLFRKKSQKPPQKVEKIAAKCFLYAWKVNTVINTKR